MVPRPYRLTRQIYRAQVHGRPTIRHTQSITLFCCPTGSGVFVSCGVSKKVASKAVLRNKLRRWMYEELTPVLPKLRSGVYVFHLKIVPQNKAFSVSKQELYSLVEQFYDRSTDTHR